MAARHTLPGRPGLTSFYCPLGWRWRLCLLDRASPGSQDWSAMAQVAGLCRAVVRRRCVGGGAGRGGATLGGATLGGGAFDTPRHGKAQHTGRYAEMREHAVGARRPRLRDEAQEVQRQGGEPAHADQDPAQRLCGPRCQGQGARRAGGPWGATHGVHDVRWGWCLVQARACVARVLRGDARRASCPAPRVRASRQDGCHAGPYARHGCDMTHVSTRRRTKHTSTQRRRRWRRRTRKKVLSSTTDIHATYRRCGGCTTWLGTGVGVGVKVRARVGIGAGGKVSTPCAG